MGAAQKRRKSWREKLESPAVRDLPKIINVPEKWQKMMGGQRVLVPTPLMADAEIRTIPKGKLITTGQLRRRLAEREGAESTCPMTLGIFLQIISGAAEESRLDGVEDIAPYWRVIKDDGSLNPKLVGGVESQAMNLQAEGHRIIPGKGRKPPQVEQYDSALV